MLLRYRLSTEAAPGAIGAQTCFSHKTLSPQRWGEPQAALFEKQRSQAHSDLTMAMPAMKVSGCACHAFSLVTDMQ